jgi:hypothetical protein
MTGPDEGTRTPEPEHQGRHGGQTSGTGPGRSGVAPGEGAGRVSPGADGPGREMPDGGEARTPELDEQGRAAPPGDAGRGRES